jgi:hypothetical protein
MLYQLRGMAASGLRPATELPGGHLTRTDALFAGIAWLADDGTSASSNAEVVVLVAFVSALAVLAIVAGGAPMHCQGPTARSPHRGCHKVVYGLFGHCRYHGFQPGRRVIATAGGGRLLLRRTCAGCGQPTVFARISATGKPFLGCSEYPACKSKRFLDR